MSASQGSHVHVTKDHPHSLNKSLFNGKQGSCACSPVSYNPTRDQVSRVSYKHCRWKKKTWHSVGEQGRNASPPGEG